MITTHRKGKVYSGPAKVDRGYLRPKISDGGGATLGGHGAPTLDPQAEYAIYIDGDTGRQYQWFDGAWH